MTTYRTVTLGCKVNQYETRQIEETLERAGLLPSRRGTAADLVVVNTCVVTSEAARQCRQVIRRLRRDHPDARLIVTGCYAVGPEADDLERLDGVSLILADKNELRRRLAEELVSSGGTARTGRGESAATPLSLEGEVRPSGRGEGVDAPSPSPGPEGPPSPSRGRGTSTPGIASFRGHARAFLKIQDGCDQFCSYCIVPHVRPHMESKPPEEVIDEARRLAAAGHREIVLTGIHLGRYGEDLGETDLLARVVEQLAGVDVGLFRGTQGRDAHATGLAADVGRVRLSSIEAGEVTPRLLAAMAARPGRVSPHLHLPLQSGDEGVLRAMRRPYTAEEFLGCVARVREALPGAAVTGDVIVGFPGESAEAYERTCDAVRRAAFSRLHVFPYSPRPGTPAAAMSGQVPADEKRRRAERLRALGEELAAAFAEGLVGREVTVLVEKLWRDEAGRRVAEGFDEHYVRTSVLLAEADTARRGDLVPARALAAHGGTLTAQRTCGDAPPEPAQEDDGPER